MHHIVIDGWSMSIFFANQARKPLRRYTTGRARELPVLTTSYRDIGRWQREHLSGDLLESQLAYWKNQLPGLDPLLELPTDRPRPPVASGRGATEYFLLSDDVARRLKLVG
jgi:hypothetical protein